MYGVVHGTLPANSHFSVYATLIETRPYENVTIEKIECTNHLLRNYCKRLKELILSTKLATIWIRHDLGKIYYDWELPWRKPI